MDSFRESREKRLRKASPSSRVLHEGLRKFPSPPPSSSLGQSSSGLVSGDGGDDGRGHGGAGKQNIGGKKVPSRRG